MKTRDTYSPLFSRLVDSPIWMEPDLIVKVWVTMLARKDADHICRGTAVEIANWAKKTEAEVIEALNVLQAPKAQLETQQFDGRMIEKVKGGWIMLTAADDHTLMTQLNRRAYLRHKQQEHRARMAQRQICSTPEVAKGIREIGNPNRVKPRPEKWLPKGPSEVVRQPGQPSQPGRPWGIEPPQRLPDVPTNAPRQPGERRVVKDGGVTIRTATK